MKDRFYIVDRLLYVSYENLTGNNWYVKVEDINSI